MSDPAKPGIRRRTFLAALGLGAVGVGGGVSWYEVARSPHRRITVAHWVSTRGSRYSIGHRGSGDVRPEHTIQAYQAAYGWGADALEISTSSTSDGVLICMHDLTYDRTTNTTGTIHDLPSSILSHIGVLQPQLGPAWTTPPLPRVPLLEDALQQFGGRMVLCIEPKRDADYDAVVAMIEQHGLRDSVIVKLFHTSPNLRIAKAAGYPVFAYLNTADVSASSIIALGRLLDASTDYLVIPTSTSAGEEYLPASLVTAAVQTGVPVWVYPVHRRSEANRYLALGVAGVISSSVGYTRNAISPVRSDTWSSGAIACGEMTRNPADPSYAPSWDPAAGVLTLAAKKPQHFVTLGQFAPFAQATGSYQLDVDTRWDVLPTERSGGVSIAFGQPDDRYYQDGFGRSDGYHGTLRATGSLELYRHVAGSRTPIAIGQAVTTPAPQPGQWMTLRLQVTPTTLTLSRLDSPAAASGSPASVSGVDGTASVSGVDTAFRGSYFHLGRTSPTGSVSFRNLRLT